ncbi:MAG TPA: hypothetical protein VMV89_05415, partial [Candidatus Paceibacterota bacterium]|nr:hypothetical protein [Candidatus Paceibacterota bacterium]
GVAVNRNKAGRHEFQTRTPCGSSICLTKNAFSKSDRLLGGRIKNPSTLNGLHHRPERMDSTLSGLKHLRDDFPA